MPKNIVIFSDGTGQDGGVRPEQRMSNIYKMYRACRVAPDTAIDPREQVALYDPGLGTDTSATGWLSIEKKISKLMASVSGRGITINIADCYEFIINHYEPGDFIFLFGFSRGAYTVRSLANLLMLCGVPTKAGAQPLSRYRKQSRDIADEAVITVLEHGAGHPREEFEAERNELARRFRQRYGSNCEAGEEGRANTAPYFIGVFDTVAALGVKEPWRLLIKAGLILGGGVIGAVAGIIVGSLASAVLWAMGLLPFWWTLMWFGVAGVLGGGTAVWHYQHREIKKTIRDFPNPGDERTHTAEWKGRNFDRLLSRYAVYARAANAIDENRADFARVPWGNTADAPDEIDGFDRIKQIWFAGNHSDIGGSYPEAESRLSDIALLWMIEQATEIPHKLKIGPVFANGEKIPNTGADGNPLHLFPAGDGVQHCEVAGMEDTIDRTLPKFVRHLLPKLGWPVALREIHNEARLHKTVLPRLRLPEVQQCAGRGPYRPEALRHHNECQEFYPQAPNITASQPQAAKT